MKDIFTRKVIYLLVTALVLLVIVLLFSFLVLIPQGKEFRIARMEKKQALYELRQYEQWSEEVSNKLKSERVKHKHIISAFATTFNPKRFVEKNSDYFESLSLKELNLKSKDKNFAIYEVNATSNINTPKQFYDFLDSLNKSDWIVGINFPINFKREGNRVLTTFTMNVYATNRAFLTSEE